MSTETNGGKTVSLALYIATLVLAIIVNAVAVTAAILSRPTEEKVQIMIDKEFKEASYLGQRLKSIENKINELSVDFEDYKKQTNENRINKR